MRDTPIITFINKLDREGRDADRSAWTRSSRVLRIRCAPGDLADRHGQALSRRLPPARRPHASLQPRSTAARIARGEIIEGLDNPRLDELLGDQAAGAARRSSNWCGAPATRFDLDAYLAGKQTPVFFGSAINNFGVQELLDAFVDYAPAPAARANTLHASGASRRGRSSRGFVFKIQANMDPSHRDRIAFHAHLLRALHARA
ncbi:MAG: GTP-binding protein [Chromatiales bacterium]|nr:GTP-binding protein [Chromatiales bacterium]